MFDLLEEMRKAEGCGNCGSAESRMDTGFRSAESLRKVAENSGRKQEPDEIRRNPQTCCGKLNEEYQGVIVKSANPQNPQPPESRKAGSRVITMTPATPNPVGEAAIKAAMQRATQGLPITPEQFRARIDDDEARWCATGRIPPKTARAYARLLADRLSRGGMNDGDQ